MLLPTKIFMQMKHPKDIDLVKITQHDQLSIGVPSVGENPVQ